ncbi:MAG: glycine betaine/L-proline ABC transporter substrate-binding protein ProX [Chloroflexota bacterium]
MLNTTKKNWLWLASLLLILALTGAACTAPAAAPADDGATEADAEEAADDGGEMAAALPGEGITVNPINGGVTTGYFQHFVLQRIIEELGYTVAEHAEAQFPALHLALGNGDVDYTANHWDPLHESFYLEAGGEESMTRLSHMITGAAQGYLIDKATADEYGITNLEDFKNPEIAALFDTDGDGLANLVGCDPGWGCERVIEHHLDAYELRDAINHDQGSYFALIADGIARFEAGEPVLYYTWTPMWLGNVIVPGEDSVWLNVPFSTQPDGGTEDTSTEDGSNTGFVMNSVRVVANNDFLTDNPVLAKLFEIYELPINDVNAQNLLVNDGENTVDDIYRHADEWIEANRDTVDGWISEAMSAAE